MPETKMSGRRFGTAVFITAVLTFAWTIGYEYVWDDPYLIGRVRDALASGNLSELFTTSFYVKNLGSARYFRPVMLATLVGEVWFTGGVPWFSHLINVLIHGANSVLVYLLLKRVLRHDLGAMAAALLFAVHPVHAEAVSAVYNRMDLLALTLLLPAAILWRPPNADPVRISALARTAAVVSFALACLTKETAFMLPAVFLGWEALRRKLPDRGSVIHFLALASVSMAVLVIRWAVFAAEGASSGSGAIKAGAFLPEALVPRFFKTLLINMRLAAWPFPFRSQWAGSDLSIQWTTALGAVLFLFLVVWAFRRCPGLAAVGMIWWLTFTLPVLGLFNIGQVAAAERYAYIPSVGLAILVGGLVASMPDAALDRRRLRYLFLAGVLILGAGAAAHTREMKNEISLFRKVAGTNPGFATIHLNLGAALAREGRFEEALASYDKAAALVPGWTDVAFNRGNLYSRIGNYEEALLHYNSVLQADPEDWEAELNMGNAYAALGRSEEAARSYRRAGDINRSSGKPLLGLGVLAARKGEYGRAVNLFADAAKAEPGLVEAYEGLGEAYIALGMHSSAESAYLKALEISPNNARAAMKLGWFLLGTGRPLQSASAFNTALAADPSLAEAWVGLVRSLDTGGEPSKARDLIADLYRSDPELAGRVRDSLGNGSTLPKH